MRKQQIFTLAIFLVLLGCAATWPYEDQEFVLDTRAGMLRAHDPKKDQDIKICDDVLNDGTPPRCRVFLIETYRALRKDYLDLKTRLETCEAGK